MWLGVGMGTLEQALRKPQMFVERLDLLRTGYKAKLDLIGKRERNYTAQARKTFQTS